MVFLPPVTPQKLINSMEKLIFDVIKNNGEQFPSKIILRLLNGVILAFVLKLLRQPIIYFSILFIKDLIK